MSAHDPKIAALTAYSEGLLSDAGRARVARHLAACATCARSLASIELYRDTTAEIRSAETPELDWSKMELALAREARAVALGVREKSNGEKGQRETKDRAKRSRPAPWGGWIALSVAAAALLALAAWPRGVTTSITEVADAGEAREPGPIEALVAPEPARVSGVVTLVSGTASVDTGGGERALDVGETIEESARIATLAGSEAHVRFAEGAGVIASADTTLVTTRMREDGIVVALERGRIAGAFSAESRFVVLASAYELEASVTRFEVTLEGDVVRLVVAEGAVTVRRPDGTIEIVRAPATWSSAGATVPPGEIAADAELAVPHGLVGDASDTSVLRLAHPDIVRWEVGGVAIAGSGMLAMRAPRGELGIAGFDASGRAFRTVAVLGADGLSLGASELQPEPPRIREGYLPREDIVAVVQRGLPRLQQCYEQALRARPELGGQLSLRITVGFDGSVARARAVGGDVPDALQACVRTQAERWTFPPPQGGPVTFEAPLRFQGR